MNSASAKKNAPKKKGYFATVPPQEILPIVNSRYESSVRGIFVIGDVTGLPLVKVAANQGREVIENLVSVPDFNATIAQLMGLPIKKETFSSSGRPFTVADKGAPIQDILT